FWALITMTAAVAVHDAILETCGLQTDIKWANDVHVNEKKLCGILAETVDIKSVVLGIGINLSRKSVSPELSETAASIESETGVEPSPEDLLQSLLRHFDKVYSVLHDIEGDKKIIAEWIKRSSYAFNKRVCVKLEDESFTGTTRGLNEFGALLVENESQIIKTVYAGELVNLRS
ncbi:MAG: biotin--[acetyl-CoA-carboxylase] ligase, partial [Pyrinomonadaceae bacterium]|nr:biotin--[acetyl-CoA-carboxylase] ligase [Pyrinomonadaceae bacterium]